MGFLFLLLLAAVSLGLTLAVSACVLHTLAWPPTTGEVCPPISVLKPLRGLEEGLFENLSSLAVQDYPRFELVLGTEDPNDPALEVAERLRSAFPTLPVTIVTSAPALGCNPKVRNLASLARHAHHEHLLISDSNVRARPGYLRALAGELARPRVGLVTSLLAGTGEMSLGALCENLHLNSFVVGSVAAAKMLGHSLVVGKSMLFSRCDLCRLGGFQGVADLLAEDYILGQRFARAGLRVALSPHVLPVFHAKRSLREFLARHLRWAQMRRRLSPASYLGEPLLNPTPWLLAVFSLSVLHAAPNWAAPAALAGLALKIGADAAVDRCLRGPPWRARALAWIPLKDLLIAGVWITGAWKSTISWRGHQLLIGPGSRLTPLAGLPLPQEPSAEKHQQAREGARSCAGGGFGLDGLDQ